MKIRSQQSKHVLGSEAFITIVDGINTDEMFKILWNKIDSFEKRFSRFDINSELSLVILISEVKDGVVYQFDSDAATGWRAAARFTYRRIRTS